MGKMHLIDSHVNKINIGKDVKFRTDFLNKLFALLKNLNINKRKLIDAELNIQRFEGAGKIIFEHKNDDITFELICTPFSIRLNTSRVTLGQLYSINTGRFEGITEQGFRIYCESISLVSYDKYRLTFTLLDNVIIGESYRPSLFTAKLFGIGKEIIDFEFRGKSIAFNTIEKYDEALDLSKNFGCKLEMGSITIQDQKEIILDIAETIKLVEQICLLLSFLFGRQITFNSCKFTNEKLECIEYYKRRLINNSRGTRYVFEPNFSQILPKMLDSFLQLEDQVKKCFQTTIVYLNSTSTKYLEDSILSMAQIWEILSDTFLNSKVENNPSIKELRTILKANIRTWHKSKEIIDYDLNFIMNRVLNSLDWEKAIKKMEMLAYQENLNSEKIGLNFKELIEIRNQIAHSGRFKQVGNEYEYLEIYNAAKLGIHVFLLNKIGFTGSLVKFPGGLPNRMSMSEMVKR